MTKIEWTDETWNPVTGCSPVSPGCAHCYAARMAKRLRGRAGYPRDRPFAVTMHLGRLNQPLRWTRRRRVFVCSMGDLFHGRVPNAVRRAAFAVMLLCADKPGHTFQVLTKRPAAMHWWFKHNTPEDCLQELWDNQSLRNILHLAYRRWLKGSAKIFTAAPPWPLPNVWLGVSAEDQKHADKRIAWLLRTPAARRFVSLEPLLGPVHVDNFLEHFRDWRTGTYKSKNGVGPWEYPWLDWVIVGGESGPRARPLWPGYVRTARDECAAAKTPFFFKSWGEWCEEWQMATAPPDIKRKPYWIGTGSAFDCGGIVYRVGRKAAGRKLDGVEWNQMPEEITDDERGKAEAVRA